MIIVGINLFIFSTLLTVNFSDEVDHADPTLAEGEEPYTHKVESIFDGQESVLGWYYLLVRSARTNIGLSDIPEPEIEGIGSKEDYENLLELPTDPINFEEENWDDDQDGEGELDVNWGLESGIPLSSHGSDTLSSKASKRSFDEVDSVGDQDEHTDGTLSPTSPGTHLSCYRPEIYRSTITGQKRSRTH